ncbi:endopeptidase La [Haploplasma axanthum]|uniref:Lon protease n=1 Tax=Haploplasma axanthum TaxID=29552 RepID=A0A449BE84_HAPAX|nr:endopeptidase La [Haploplasma axanthum]VEU80738.1 ATP-dependent protease La [Haploplasma axanthum]
MESIKSLPAVAVRGVVPIPNNDFRIEVGRKKSLDAIEASEKDFGQYILIAIQKDPLNEDPTVDDIEEYGTLAKISMKIKLPNGNFKVKFNVLERVKIKEFFLTEPYFVANYDEVETNITSDEEEVTLVKMIVQEIAENETNILMPNNNVIEKVQQGLTTNKVVDLIVNFLKIEETEKYRYLAENSLNKRLKMLLEDINRQKMIIDLERKINEEVKKSIDENQKEYYLREKMRAIQNELGDKVKREEEIEELRELIIEAKMPANIEEKALQELARLRSTPSAMAESSIIKTYLDFLVALPWYETSKDLDDLSLVQKSLDKNHYGLEKVKDRIVEYLAVKIMTQKNPQTILCLVGPPGVGKTSLAISIAEALNRKFVKQSLGGVRDESEIRGHRRTYIGALPGRILNGMKAAGTLNPVFLLDEIDKMASDYKGDPASAMLEVLDPEQNSKFSDHYLEEQYDLSQVLFITTANYLENIPAPLRDRMEIVELSSYTEHEKFEIAKRHLVSKQLEAHGLKPEQFILDDEVIYYMIQHYTREAGVRELNRYIGALIRKAIKEILITKEKSVHISKDNVENYIGKPKFTHNTTENKDRIGVVTGLAYTQYGGDTLPVEVTYYKGRGQLVLTGKLGDVMKESAQTALSYVKANAERFNIDPELFKENDVHVHVPEGAIPKDGPSAGITMATAIYSALANKFVKRDVGMTGEVTLRGLVLPIGGLKEKSIAAHRSGIKTILIPKDNVRDIDDIPVEVKENLTIIPVETVDDVFANAIK